jgi:cobalt-zinc-cadmium efflux system protein
MMRFSIDLSLEEQAMAGHDHAHEAPDGKHDHAHSGGSHSHAPSVNTNNERAVLLGFVLTFGFMIAEAAGGLISGSLALIADAGHMLTDSAALALAWAGFYFGRKSGDNKRTFGYMRFEVLAGFINALALILLVVWIAYEAVMRLLTPSSVLAGPMFLIAVLGLFVNIGVFMMLMKGDSDHVNIKGAMLHVLGDLLGSVAAIVAAIVIYFTSWMPIDPILSLLLSALVLRSAWVLLKNSLNILMEGSPHGANPETMRAHLRKAVDGVADVHHVHVWSITSGQTTATMEITLVDGADPADTQRRLKSELSAEFEIRHSTIEIDWDGHKNSCPIERQNGAKKPDASTDKGHTGHDHGHAAGGHSH